MSNNVVVSAWSAIFGSLTDLELFDAAFKDDDLTHHIQPDTSRLPQIISKHEQVLMGTHALNACMAIEQAFLKAQLWKERNLLRGKGKRFRHSRAAIIAGSSLGMIKAVTDAKQNPAEKIHPYTLSKVRGNSISAPLAIRFGLGAGDFSLSAASATGGQAIWLAAQLIKLNVADIVVVVCSDISKGSEFTENALNAIGAVASSSSSRPLCSNRDGMRPIEASAAVILESESHAIKRGFRPLARWIGGAIKNDCHHLIAPEPNGKGLEEAFVETMSNLKNNTTIDWLSLHATGTKAWDQIEASLVNKLFATKIPHISAFKRTFGHTLSSACLLSISMIAEGLSKQKLPQLPQFIDPKLNLKLNTQNIAFAKTAMNWSVGMGGTVAVNLFEHYHVG